MILVTLGEPDRTYFTTPERLVNSETADSPKIRAIAELSDALSLSISTESGTNLADGP